MIQEHINRQTLGNLNKTTKIRLLIMKITFVVPILLSFILMPFSHAQTSNNVINSPSVTMLDEYTIKGDVNFYSGISPGDEQGNINVVVEIPKGSTGKWEVDKSNGTIIWEHKKGKPRTVSYLGGYPANYGSVPRTALTKEFGGDGDPLDVVIVGDVIPRGEVVKIKLIGIINLIEGEGEFDGKLLGVRVGTPHANVSDFHELNSKFDGMGDTVVKWFTSYKGPGEITLQNIGSSEEAMEIVNISAAAFE